MIDSLTPVLLVSFGLTRSVATLGVLGWRLVNFWLPIPAGAAAYISLKVPRGADRAAMRQALREMVSSHKPARKQEPTAEQGGTADEQEAAADEQETAEDRS